ncbi:MAG: lipopolysaccharide heptosyltransferase II [Bryobacteraceae bacterium]|nr:lipopolysaccharide heptosyltransferase II [Bryobacteraceae bacterium]
MRILVRATNWVGDAVMSLPALQVLRERFRDAHIAVLARPWVADIYAREPFADELIAYTAGRGWRDSGSKLKLAAELRRRKFDMAVLLQNAFEAAALVWLAGIPRRIGYDRDARGFLLTDAIAVPKSGEIPAHQRFYYLELLRRAGIVDALPEWPAIRLSCAHRAAEAGRARFAEKGWSRITGVSPGAAFGTAKRWLPERFASAAADLGNPVALFGSGDERELCEVIAEAIRRRGLEVWNCAGQTRLAEYIDLAAACSVYLTNDSGGMHIASALGVATVAVFGATDHDATGPTGPLARIVREPVDCSPCLLRECPIDHRCMTGVSTSSVVAVAQEVSGGFWPVGKAKSETGIE